MRLAVLMYGTCFEMYRLCGLVLQHTQRREVVVVSHCILKHKPFYFPLVEYIYFSGLSTILFDFYGSQTIISIFFIQFWFYSSIWWRPHHYHWISYREINWFMLFILGFSCFFHSTPVCERIRQCSMYVSYMFWFTYGFVILFVHSVCSARCAYLGRDLPESQHCVQSPLFNRNSYTLGLVQLLYQWFISFFVFVK